MTAFDVQWEAAELKHTILSLKAVAENFSSRFTEHETALDVLAVQTAHEEYVYLFRALFNIVCEARDQALHLEASAEELLDLEIEGRKRELKRKYPGTKQEKKRNSPGTNEEENGK